MRWRANTGICTKIPILTDDPKEELGDTCEKLKKNALYKATGVRPTITEYMSVKKSKLQKMFSFKRIKQSVVEQISIDSEKHVDSNLGVVCCPIPYSHILYGTAIDNEKKLPRGYKETGAGTACIDSKTCNADEFCDDSSNVFHGRGDYDRSAPGENPLRFCYKFPIDDYATYEDNEKRTCVDDDECDPNGVCRKIPLQQDAIDPYLAFCGGVSKPTSSQPPVVTVLTNSEKKGSGRRTICSQS
ncbi:unnamed protein product [Caenorhabditis auriculariae]|uniref:Uncharacterized protein n=1 Tax=Caenorhabditis auriculariae TaxID=2777116 RepID=A0A8S1HNX0_9PELO|nr:unnamed protein product [Caenorhabditis auriculariae]